MADEELGTPESAPEATPDPGIAASPISTPTPPEPESFIDPRDLPAEILPHFKRMQAAYTKKTQALAADREKVQLVDQFRNNPEFARQLVLQEAQRLGITLAPATPQTPRPASSAIPPEYVQALAAELPQELQWMAPALASATYKGVAHLTTPMLQQNQQRIKEERETEWDSLAAQLNERQPGWETHEDDMLAMYEFLQSPKLKHPVYGSKLDLLLSLVTGNATATQQAIQRMSQAGRQRVGTGQTSRTSVPNITDRVRKAPTTRDAWQEAARAAVAQLGQGGGA
jgi:hypothetical protein